MMKRRCLYSKRAIGIQLYKKDAISIEDVEPAEIVKRFATGAIS